MINSTDPTKTSGRSIRQERLTGHWVGYSWEQVTCLQIDSWAVIEGMTEAEARSWLAN